MKAVFYQTESGEKIVAFDEGFLDYLFPNNRPQKESDLMKQIAVSLALAKIPSNRYCYVSRISQLSKDSVEITLHDNDNATESYGIKLLHFAEIDQSKLNALTLMNLPDTTYSETRLNRDLLEKYNQELLSKQTKSFLSGNMTPKYERPQEPKPQKEIDLSDILVTQDLAKRLIQEAKLEQELKQSQIESYELRFADIKKKYVEMAPNLDLAKMRAAWVLYSTAIDFFNKTLSARKYKNREEFVKKFNDTWSDILSVKENGQLPSMNAFYKVMLELSLEQITLRINHFMVHLNQKSGFGRNELQQMLLAKLADKNGFFIVNSRGLQVDWDKKLLIQEEKIMDLTKAAIQEVSNAANLKNAAERKAIFAARKTKKKKATTSLFPKKKSLSQLNAGKIAKFYINMNIAFNQQLDKFKTDYLKLEDAINKLPEISETLVYYLGLHEYTKNIFSQSLDKLSHVAPLKDALLSLETALKKLSGLKEELDDLTLKVHKINDDVNELRSLKNDFREKQNGIQKMTDDFLKSKQFLEDYIKNNSHYLKTVEMCLAVNMSIDNTIKAVTAEVSTFGFRLPPLTRNYEGVESEDWEYELASDQYHDDNESNTALYQLHHQLEQELHNLKMALTNAHYLQISMDDYFKEAANSLSPNTKEFNPSIMKREQDAINDCVCNIFDLTYQMKQLQLMMLCASFVNFVKKTDFWAEQVRWFGGERFGKVKVPKGIKLMNQAIQNYPDWQKDQVAAEALLKRFKEIALQCEKEHQRYAYRLGSLNFIAEKGNNGVKGGITYKFYQFLCREDFLQNIPQDYANFTHFKNKALAIITLKDSVNSPKP